MKTYQNKKSALYRKSGLYFAAALTIVLVFIYILFELKTEDDNHGFDIQDNSHIETQSKDDAVILETEAKK